MQTATSGTESKSLDLSICVHHFTLRAPCPKGQGVPFMFRKQNQTLTTLKEAPQQQPGTGTKRHNPAPTRSPPPASPDHHAVAHARPSPGAAVGGRGIRGRRQLRRGRRQPRAVAAGGDGSKGRRKRQAGATAATAAGGGSGRQGRRRQVAAATAAARDSGGGGGSHRGQQRRQRSGMPAVAVVVQ